MYGLTGEEFVKALEKGQISAKAVEQAFINLTGTSGKYFNGATAQSETLAGKWSTLIDAVTRLAQNLGQTLGPALKGILNLAINITNAIVGMIQKINQAWALVLRMRLGSSNGTLHHLRSGWVQMVVAVMQSMRQELPRKKELASLRAELEKTAESVEAVNKPYTAGNLPPLLGMVIADQAAVAARQALARRHGKQRWLHNS